jgi:multidrug efflux pump
LMNLPIKIGDGTTIHFKDIARVHRAFVDADNRSRVNGESSLVLDVKKRVGANLIEVAEATREIIDEEVALMSGDVKVNYLLDKSKNVRSTLSDLGNNVTAAVLIVMIVVVASLGLRNAALVALAIPGSFLIGIAFLYNMGITLNIVVLFSLILVAGMLVDGVIVTIEYADRRIAQSVDRATAYREGAVRMAWPIIASTVTTLMVFLPLLFWPGIVGSFMRFLPITVICVLSASLLMALIFIPVLGGIFGKKASLVGAAHHSAPRSYRWILKRAIQYPMYVVLIVTGFMIVSFGGYFSAGLGVSFFPDVEPEQAAIQVLSRGDLAADERDDLLRQAETRVLDLAGVSAKYARLGSDESAPRDSIGSIRTVFDDWQQREKASVLMDEMRRRLEGVVGIKVNIQAEEGGPGGGAPIHIEIFNNKLGQAAQTTNAVVDLMEEIGGFVDIKDTRPLPGIEWTIEFDRDEASRHGVSIDALGNMVKLLTGGVSISDYRPDDIDDELDIKLRFPVAQRNLDHLQELRIPTALGDYVPLSVFAKLIPWPKGGDIERKNGKRFYSIDADVKEGLLPATQVETLQSALAENQAIWRSSSIVFGGESEDIAETQAFFGQAFSLSMCLMILVLMIQFNSVWQTFVTMSAIILSSGGVFLGLWLMGRPFGIVMSGLGIIALAGVVVNNNIVLIDTFNEFRTKGYGAKQAAFHAGLARFRPVLLTAVTTIMGLLPMVFGLTIQFGQRSILSGAPSSQWWTDLSSTIAGGLTFATILTLLATPALLVLGANVDARVKRITLRFFARQPSRA